jgi:hypothetical protein
MRKIIPSIHFFAITLLFLSISFSINAQMPSWYKGKPFMGKPQVIPGRIEFENHDEGGFDVGFNTDYISEGPIKNYRKVDNKHTNIDETNTNPNVDLYPDGSIYPSKENPHSYYLGWTHVGDWTRFTLYVTKTDDYIISSTFAEELDKIGFFITFNNEKKRFIYLNYGKGGFHTWKKFDSIITVRLDSGLNLMHFETTITHLNYDYLEFTPLNPKPLAKSIKTDSLDRKIVNITFNTKPNIELCKINLIKILRGNKTITIENAQINPKNENMLLLKLAKPIQVADNTLTISWPEKTIVSTKKVESDALTSTSILNILKKK